jgi:hypothetical protein
VAPLAAGLIGWVLAGSFRLGLQPGTSVGLTLTARIIVSCLAVAVGLCLAALIMRTHLAVSDEGLADHRMFRVVRVPWQLIAGFEVGRPGALWGGFCVTAICRDNVTIDLMATGAYSLVPSAQHLDELRRICWSLEEAASKWQG